MRNCIQSDISDSWGLRNQSLSHGRFHRQWGLHGFPDSISIAIYSNSWTWGFNAAHSDAVVAD